MEQENIKKRIVETLTSKSSLKQTVYDNTLKAHEMIKKALKEIVADYNPEIKNIDPRIKLQYTDHGPFESELKIAGDLLIFNVHSNVFEFNREHEIWKTDYIKTDPTASFSGIISIFNFLSDSFKYNRYEDLGYLIARVFINKDFHFFVEGKRQTGFGYSNMGKKEFNDDSARDIINAAMKYALDFDLLVPPYDNVKIASVAQIHEKIKTSKLQTGKRLGFQFRSDDISEE